MTDPNDEETAATDPYLAEHVREALARDPRVGQPGIGVEIAGDTATLRGDFSSQGQQQAAVETARALLPDHAVRDETAVADFPEPEAGDAEHLP